MAKKQISAAERRHLDRLTDLGCLPCLNSGHGQTRKEDTAVHHKKSGNGSSRASHLDTIPMCGNHHQHGGYGVAFHAGQAAWEKRYGTEDELIEQAHRMLGLGDYSLTEEAEYGNE